MKRRQFLSRFTTAVCIGATPTVFSLSTRKIHPLKRDKFGAQIIQSPKAFKEAVKHGLIEHNIGSKEECYFFLYFPPQRVDPNSRGVMGPWHIFGKEGSITVQENGYYSMRNCFLHGNFHYGDFHECVGMLPIEEIP